MIYEDLKVKTYINAMDPVAAYGGNLLSPTVLDAMEEATRSFVRMDELHRAVGERIAEMTHNEGAAVVSGASAGMMMCAAALMTREEPERLMGLPDITGLKNEILILEDQLEEFEGKMCIVGVRLKPVRVQPHHPEQLAQAAGKNTAAVYYAQMRHPGMLTFEEALQAAKQVDLPLVVDADAQLPPKEALWSYTQAGAAAAIFAGGRALRGPSGSALVVGEKWLTDRILSIAPPRHSIASVANIGREEIIGLYAALEEYLAGDDYAAAIERVEKIIREERYRIEAEGYFLCKRSYPGPSGQNYPRMLLEILGSYSAEALVEMLEEGDPAILVTRTDNSESENGIYINLITLTDEEVKTVLRRVDECAESLTALH